MLKRIHILMLLASTVMAVPTVRVVDISDNSTELSTKLSVRVCAGIYNRDVSSSAAVYTLDIPGDSDWLNESAAAAEYVSYDDFLEECLGSGRIKGYIRYNWDEQQILIPNIITIAGVLDAVPLMDGQAVDVSAPLVFDAVEEFKGFTALDATKYVYDQFVDQTTAMSKMNPGLVAPSNQPAKPELKEQPNIVLTDFIVKEKLFNFFLWYGCINDTPENDLVIQMTTNNPWPNPIPVYGYDDSWVIAGGDTWEAETYCVPNHNMGTIASNNVTNLSYFSSAPPITEPMKTNPSDMMKYDRKKTYISFIIGDGDNISLVQTRNKKWIQERVSRCEQDSSKKGCFPLLWSMSPHLTRAAPGMLEWFYHQFNVTGRDYFVLPPSGNLYAYPSAMPSDVQAAFVSNTENDCKLLNTNAIVGWEFASSWPNAFENYFPQYAKNDVVQAVFALNVPYMVPIIEFLPFTTYRILKDKLVMFKPREWRGVDGSSPKKYYLSPGEMAEEINKYRRGTVTHIYMTSDGGLDINALYEMVAKLEDHVEIVDSRQLANLALQRSGKNKLDQEWLHSGSLE